MSATMRDRVRAKLVDVFEGFGCSKRRGGGRSGLGALEPGKWIDSVAYGVSNVAVDVMSPGVD